VTAILDESHRGDLEPFVGRFIRAAEGSIARKLRAMEMLVYGTFTDVDRAAEGSAIYTLPADCLSVRAIWAPKVHDGTRSRELNPTSLHELRSISTAASVTAYGMRGRLVEFRGIPPLETELQIDYYGRPTPLVDDEDTTLLLDEHPEVYESGALFFLHRFTQDLDTAQGYLDSFNAAVKDLNETAAHKIGGTTQAPSYNFSSPASY
jgi:hypothetical protein